MQKSNLNEVHHFVCELEGQVKPLMIEEAKCYWELATTGKQNLIDHLLKTQLKLNEFLSNKNIFDNLNKIRDNTIEDDTVKRQIELIYNEMLKKQVDVSLLEKISNLETEIEGIYINYRATLSGKRLNDAEIDRILENENNVDHRRNVYLASKDIGDQVASKVLSLIRLRNKAAQELGYSNYYSLSLETAELNEQKLFSLLTELDRYSEDPFKKVKKNLDEELSERFSVHSHELMPWYYDDRFFQKPSRQRDLNLDTLVSHLDLERTTTSFYKDLNMDIEAILKKSDLYPRDGKNQHAFCISIDRSHDIRVLCNNRPSARWLGTMLHEFGHAVYDKYISPELPFILRQPSHTLTTEAIALLMERQYLEPAFLVRYAEMSEQDASSFADKLQEFKKARLLVFTRWALVMINFERELYRNPDRSDLNNYWWDLVERYQLLNRPEDRKLHADWAAKIHLATSPVYYQNYLLGEMLASQILGSFCDIKADEQLIINNKEAGKMLMEKIFQPGSIMHWNDLVIHATGSLLQVDPYMRDLLGDVCVDIDWSPF